MDLLNLAVRNSRIHTQSSSAAAAFFHHQVAFAGTASQDLSCTSNLKPLCGGLFGLHLGHYVSSFQDAACHATSGGITGAG